ncbi:hypothetical protein TIFTF001_015433 [Ficus carica]|uniref:Retrotransposon gag domain-containing protein n=1 Tax=Ficus carica TaxID=3494 RepID=A0AA88ALJ2_FICCA|nr:hypothetical protein TIFTF001_015433 [Ficus carica]
MDYSKSEQSIRPSPPTIMAVLYPARFKLPKIVPYDGSTDADEYLENYQSHMLIQNVNEATIYKAFCLIVTGTVIMQLSDAFSAVFFNLKTRKKETLYLFRIKQGENEPLKGYLDRFDKAIMQVKNGSDDTLIQAFREGVGEKKLLWTIAYDVPPTFVHLRGIVQKHAETKEYIRGWNSLLEETS